MGVTSEAWWAVWWPWMLLWAVTGAGLAALLTVGLLRLVRARRAATQDLTDGICFYLHDKTVMDHYQMGGYTAALRKEVEQRTSDSKDGTVRAKVFGVGADGGRKENTEIVSRYLEVAEPISVIGLIMKVLEEKRIIVHVDLPSGSVVRSPALLRTASGAQGAVRLRDIEGFVLIRGRFRATGDGGPERGGSTVFLAPYGDPADPSRAPRVRISCATEGLRNQVPRGTFLARCLGKVQEWNPEEGVLEVQAMAVFR
ncbi:MULTISPECIES: hypothetical protein [unclassified Streptomyces]|uniref:Uncharacterized protein n=1 Tax=Streptomyces sp. R33 TaxID=3238629 RepID=A0AB39XX62_9ACTN|nr:MULTISPECIES: hypothetical protein [unclassified Streptomyces]